MKLSILTLGLLLFLLFTSCNRVPTLQSYLVACQTKKGFVTMDLPIGLIQPKKDREVTDQIRTTYESMRKINLAVLPLPNNEVTFETEKKNLEAIFKVSDFYKHLVRADIGGMKLNLYYNGDQGSIDEMVVFGYSNEVGLGVARVLGDHMNPQKMIQLIRHLEIDPTTMNFQEFSRSLQF